MPKQPDAKEQQLFQNNIDKAARIARRLQSLDEQRKAIARKLDVVKAELCNAVTTVPSALNFCTETDGGGLSWNVPARNGCTVRITHPGKRIVSEIAADALSLIKEICGRRFSALFEPRFLCVKSFREMVFRELPKESAEKLLSLCEEDSKPTVTVTKPKENA